ncbi:hypothetical protein HPC49_04990 [Pyxidicoccus fallax]|uniref:Uncharacterized protein n=1 Tax=Pyxidicoccus fallax TaxID=394095 RepID=A0A848L8F3_9BACT|nr:hypothetical protein [Pyxidicoccus fallax]NMO15280.1 hypothetical protein [Pyxidicoccus fallax]NPC77607.1 hypothetical protein [Pyxidicoccus fallax]
MKTLLRFFPVLVCVAVFVLGIVLWRRTGEPPPPPAVPVSPVHDDSERAQRSPLFSPDGRYVAKVEILEGPCPEKFGQCWVVSFHTPEGEELFRDREGFPLPWNVYWAWDARGRFWLYNTDDGAEYIWTRQGTRWMRELAPFLPYEACMKTATPDPRCPPPVLADVVYKHLKPRE